MKLSNRGSSDPYMCVAVIKPSGNKRMDHLHSNGKLCS